MHGNGAKSRRARNRQPCVCVCLFVRVVWVRWKRTYNTTSNAGYTARIVNEKKPIASNRTNPKAIRSYCPYFFVEHFFGFRTALLTRWRYTCTRSTNGLRIPMWRVWTIATRTSIGRCVQCFSLIALIPFCGPYNSNDAVYAVRSCAFEYEAKLAVVPVQLMFSIKSSSTRSAVWNLTGELLTGRHTYAHHTLTCTHMEAQKAQNWALSERVKAEACEQESKENLSSACFSVAIIDVAHLKHSYSVRFRSNTNKVSPLLLNRLQCMCARWRNRVFSLNLLTCSPYNLTIRTWTMHVYFDVERCLYGCRRSYTDAIVCVCCSTAHIQNREYNHLNKYLVMQCSNG